MSGINQMRCKIMFHKMNKLLHVFLFRESWRCYFGSILNIYENVHHNVQQSGLEKHCNELGYKIVEPSQECFNSFLVGPSMT